MDMKRIDEIKWGDFKIMDIFTISPGVRLTKADMIEGIIPFVGASDSNNGITAFCGNDNPSKDSNVLGVNYNGSVVENFYHPYTALFSDDVKRPGINPGFYRQQKKRSVDFADYAVSRNQLAFL